ncbi:MAG TPA: HAMP domain-containing sensor histidine kinase, partial [Solirubrobacteraceae bacterium]|nr:HAMP domain-containing sensor histidine kinase [Solirubrobacteraceae bacterium]
MSRPAWQGEVTGTRFAGRRRRVLGLRPRVFAALLLSSAVTLAVAAPALLSPLEHRLRADGEKAVYAAISASRAEFAEIGVDPSSGRPDTQELAASVALLRRRSGAQVTVLDHRLNTVYSPINQDLDVPDYYSQVSRALRSGRGVHTLIGDELVAAEPMQIGKNGPTDAVVLVRRLQYVSSAVNVVQKAFIEAAAVGFGIALLLGLALTTTLLRRLERLREAAGELERRGLEAPIHVDGRRDEIGDLTRAFASMQARLRRQEEARHAFVATASHELRTPLTSLDGTLELLEDDLDASRLDLDDARERAVRAREQSRRLSNLATDLLDLSRLDAEVSLRAEPVELGEVSRAVAAEFEHRAADRGVRIESHQAAQACWALCDPGAVARIVRILLDNAIGLAPSGSTVRTHTASDERWAQVTVS